MSGNNDLAEMDGRFEPLVGKVERNFEGYIATVILFVYTFLISYTILSRVVPFLSPPAMTLELTLALFTWMTWLAAAWAIRFESHFRFTLAREKLSNRANYLLRYFDAVLWIVTAGIILFFTIEITQTRMESGRIIFGTPIPLYVAYAAVPVGMALIVLRSTQQMIRVRRRYRNGEDITPDSSIQE